MLRILLITGLLLHLAKGAREADRVTELPGIPKSMMKSDWYSGYYQITKYKHLHYLFMKSLNTPATDPIIVYFSGGPGSTTFDIAFMGLGPVKAK